MAARVSRISDITLRAVIALCLASLCVVQSAAHPRRADAVPIAIPIVVGVGAVLATALGAYGIQAVNSGRSVEDVGTSFISWITSKDLDDFWDAQTDIKSAQMAIDAIYQMGLDGSMALGDWTTNEQNAINSVYGSLMQMWASDGFAAVPPSVPAGSTVVNFGNYSVNTFYSTNAASSYGISAPSAQINNAPIFGYIIANDAVYFIGNSTGTTPAVIVSTVDGSWCVSSRSGTYRPYVNSGMSMSSSGAVWGRVSSDSFPDVDISSIYINTYYDCSIWTYNSSISSAGNNATADDLIGRYEASLDLWSGDVTVDSGIEGSIFDKFSDALSQGINDLLSQQIPLGADYVYNPSTQALEQQGSVPVIQDWSRVADWADVLERLRAGTLDGSQVIDNTTTGVRADTISDTLVEGEAIQDWPMRSWETPSMEVGTIGAAINFTGETIGEKFPFSTWGDVVAISNILAVDAVAPEFDMPVIGFDGSGFTVERVHISLAGFEGVAIVIRLMFLILMILGVIWLAVRQLKAFQGV